MAGKKPVWVDEEAHAILKKYSKLVKCSMVDVASKLVSERLGELDPDAGLGAPSSPAAAASVQPDTARPQATSKPSMSAKKAARPRPRRHDPNDENVRFVGGIWFV